MLLERLEDRRVLATWNAPLTADTTWGSGEIHEITGNVTVESGVTLTIEPGAIVKFHPGSTNLFVDGILDAQGTSSENIVFTSIRDDVGGDTNGDGGASVPAAGDWPRIQVNGSGTITHAQVRYGGSFQAAMVLANGGDLAISGSSLSDSASAAVRINGADPTLADNQYHDNAGAAISMDLNSNPAISGVALSGNGINGLQVDAGLLAKNLVWDDPDIVYWLSDDVTVPNGRALQIGAGQIIKPSSGVVDLNVDGMLTIAGTTTDPVVFTSAADDTIGGDTNGDGQSTAPAAGDWGQIHLRPDSSGNTIDHLHSHYGGQFFIGSSLLATDTDVSISNSAFSHSRTDGIRLQGTDATLTGNVFTGNVDAAVSMDLNSNPTISGVTANDNGINGLQVDAGLLARDLVWDDPDIVFWLSNDVTVPIGRALQIGAGQIIKPSDAVVDLNVDGMLTIAGTTTNPVVFTSAADDTIGGDTNGDGQSTGPTSGDWGRIHLRGDSSGNTIDHLQSHYGGQFFIGSSLLATDTDVSISNSVFSHSETDGIRLQGTDAALTGNVFTGNVDAAVSMDLNSNPTIRGVTATGNGINGLQVDAGLLAKDLVWDDPEIVYWLDNDVTVPSGRNLQIGAGQIIKPSDVNVDLIVDGTLNINGTVESPVVVTSRHDDSAGGDTNNNGDATAPSIGDWARVWFRGGSTGNSIDHADLRYGGDFFGGTVVVDSASLTMANTRVHRSDTNAVLAINDATVNLTNNVLNGSLRAGILAASGSQVIAINNTIDGNRRGVVSSEGDTNVELTNNLITFHSTAGVVSEGGGVVTLAFNDVFNPASENYAGLADPNGTDGNLSADPKYFSAANGQYFLRSGSPAIDSATSDGTPLVDQIGQPRFDDPNVINSGGGPQRFFDMGAFERQEISSSQTDLATVSVSSAASGLQGEVVMVNWTVESVGSEPADGSWRDGVFLSFDTVWTPDDILLGEFEHTGTLGPGQSYVAGGEVTLPGVLPGNYFFIVRSDVRNQVFEALNERNNSQASGAISMDLPELTLGSPLQARLEGTGEVKFFKVAAPDGADLTVNLTGPATVDHELFVSYADLPSRQRFDERGIRPDSPDQTVTIVDTQGGQYIVMVYGADVPGGGETFTLGASLEGFGINAVSPVQGSNAGQVTITVDGAGMSSATDVKFVDSAGMVITPLNVHFVDTGRAAASFDLTGAALGPADIQLINPGDVVASLEDSFNVIAGQPGRLVTNVIGPGVVRLGRTFEVTVEYSNQGDQDLLAPIMRLAGSGLSSLSLTKDFTGAGNDISFIGASSMSPAGILPPGGSGSVTIYGRAGTGGSESFDLLIGDYPATAIDWNAIGPVIQPAEIEQSLWDLLLPQLELVVGATWSDFNRAISKDATLMPASRGLNHSLRDVFQLEVDTAYAELETSVSGILSRQSTGNPIAGALITLVDSAAGEVATAVSNTDGTFLVPAIAAGTYRADIDGYVVQAPSEIVVGTENLIDLPIEVVDGGQIAGSVVLDSGAPVRNLLVTATGESGQIFSGATDNSGLFVIDSLPTGVYEMTAGGGTLTTDAVEGIALTAGQIRRNVSLVVAQASSISGRVTGPQGNVGDAEVVATGTDGSTFSALSSDTGEYVIDGLPGGLFDLQVFATGFAPARVEDVTVAAGEMRYGIDLAVNAGGTLGGAVTLAGDGSPASFAFLALTGAGGNFSAQVEADGNYQFDSLPAGTYRLSVGDPDYMIVESTVNIVAGTETTENLITANRGTISGRVTETGSGDPLTKVIVQIADDEFVLAETLTDDNGDYSIDGLDAGSYFVSIGDGETPGLSTSQVELTVNATSAAVDLSTDSVGAIAGAVFQSDGVTPVPDASVILFEDGRQVLSTTTNLAGQYHFVILSNGDYELHATAEDLVFPVIESVEVSNSNQFGQSFQAGSDVLTGGVVDLATGLPVPDAMVSIDRIDAGVTRDIVAGLFVDESGQFELTMAPGTYRVTAVAENFATSSQVVTITAGVPADVDFNLEMTGLLTGTVRDAGSGQAVAGVTVDIYDSTDPEFRVSDTTDESGQYHFSSLPAAEYDVVVRADAFRSVVLPGITTGEAITVRDVSLESPSTSVSGAVRADGMGLARVLVFVEDADGRTIAEATTSPDGSYVIDELPSESYSVMASASGYRAASPAPLVISDGQMVSGLDLEINPVAITDAEVAVRSASSAANPAWFADFQKRPERNAFHPSETNLISIIRGCSQVTFEVLKRQQRASDAIAATDKAFKNWLDAYEGLKEPLSQFAFFYREIQALARDVDAALTPVDPLLSYTHVQYVFEEQGIVNRIKTQEVIRDFEAIRQELVGLIEDMKDNSTLSRAQTRIDQLAGTRAGIGLLDISSILRVIGTSLTSGRAVIGFSTLWVTKGTYGRAALRAAERIDSLRARLREDKAEAPDLKKLFNSLERFRENEAIYNQLVDRANGALASLNIACVCGQVVGLSPSRMSAEVTGDDAAQLLDTGACPRPPVIDPIGQPGEPNDPAPDAEDAPGLSQSLINILRTIIAFSLDPNAKIGPAAFGDQAFVQPGTLNYEIQFENDPDLGATLSAERVRIEDTLDDDLDFSTVEFVSFGFNNFEFDVPPGLSRYETTIDLRPDGIDLLVPVVLDVNLDSGELTASFASLDPLTGLVPDDIDAGFLPVNDKQLHNGEGFIRYRVRPNSGLPSGTEITNQANIFFDDNPPVPTLPPTRHTIDRDDPTSNVSDLPAAAVARDFMVDWSGQDDVGGSGVASYDIFVSENGGALTPWLLGTTETSSLFTGGEIGTTYGFLSVARDNVGHREAMPLLPDTQTIVGPWVNPINVFDVNAVDGPTALDVLLIINELGRNTVSDPDTGLLVELPPQGFAPPFYDVAFDGFITALDALRVINELGRLQGQGEAVGESVDEAMLTVAQQLVHTSLVSNGRAVAEEAGEAEDVLERAVLKVFDSGDLSSLDASESVIDPAANVDPVGQELDSTLRTLADDVADQWAVV